jgi:hypothetical protein
MERDLDEPFYISKTGRRVDSFRFQWVAGPTPSVEAALQISHVLVTAIDEQLRHPGA